MELNFYCKEECIARQVLCEKDYYGRSVPKDIYQRIKKLEDKILELEGISPEYFQSLDISNKRKKVQPSQKYSLMELDRKINALTQSLLQK